VRLSALLITGPHDMPDSLYIGAALLVLFLIIAFLAVSQGWLRGARSRLTLATPASPSARDASSDLFNNLKRLVLLGQGFECKCQEVKTVVNGIRHGAAHLTRVLGGFEKKIANSPPTYSNYAAVYRGLAGSDETLLAAADSYASSARAILGRAAEKRASAANWHVGVQAEAEEALGRTLADMGTQLRKVVNSVHCLGAALDLE